MSVDFDLNLRMNAVFPVYILTGTVPKIVLDALLQLTDYILAEKSSDLDYSGYLAGHIKKGKQVQIPVNGQGLEKPEFINVIKATNELIAAICKKYIAKTSEISESSQVMWSKHKLVINDMWIVSQYEGDFNPVHTHATTLSGIIYLKVPPQINAENIPAGWLNCVYGNSWDPLRLNFSGTLPIMPVVGNILLFPSWLNHGVYPFEGEGERRCLPFNVYATPLGGGKF